MRKFFVTLSILCVTVCTALGQSRVLESLEMPSKLLKTNVKYSVYLPDGYDHSERKYPIVYLLNGYTGDERDWIQFGNMQNIMDSGITNSDFPAMIVVMPDGDDRLYVNKYDGTYPYGDMLIEELIPYVESQYRVRSEKQFRAVSGLSMGGAGCLILAFKHHDLFGAVAAFSSAIRTDEEFMAYRKGDGWDNYFGRAFGTGLEGTDRLTDFYRKNNVLDLAKNTDANALKSVRIYFDCGDDDYLSPGNAYLHLTLKSREIPHEFRMNEGAHTWPYWREHLPTGMQFIGNLFSR